MIAAGSRSVCVWPARLRMDGLLSFLLVTFVSCSFPDVATQSEPGDQCSDPSIPNPAAYVQLTIQLNQISNRVDQLSTRIDQSNYRVDQLQDAFNKFLTKQKRACGRTTVAELPLSLNINKTTSFSVLARNCEGDDLTTGGDTVTAVLTCVDYPSLVSPKPTVVDNGDGSYLVSLTPACSGHNRVSVSINGKTIQDMPVTVAVIPHYQSLKLKRTITVVGRPLDLDFSENGDVYAGGWNDHHVYHFDRSGNQLNKWILLGKSVGGILLYGDNIIVSQCYPPKVYNYTKSGLLVGPVFADACYYDLIVGADGRLYGSNWAGGCISIFNMEDNSLFHQISGVGQPRGIGLDLDGNIHFSAWKESPKVVNVYTPSGVLVRKYSPTSVGQIDGIFIDKAGNRLVADRQDPSRIVITDKNNNLIHKLKQGKTVVRAVITPNGDVWVTSADSNEIYIFSE